MGDSQREGGEGESKGNTIITLVGLFMKYYHQDYESIMRMPAHRFYMLLDEIQRIENTDKQETKKKGKPLESNEDYLSFFGQ